MYVHVTCKYNMQIQLMVLRTLFAWKFKSVIVCLTKSLERHPGMIADRECRVCTNEIADYKPIILLLNSRQAALELQQVSVKVHTVVDLNVVPFDIVVSKPQAMLVAIL